jgi:hypothetical protein
VHTGHLSIFSYLCQGPWLDLEDNSGDSLASNQQERICR